MLTLFLEIFKRIQPRSGAVTSYLEQQRYLRTILSSLFNANTVNELRALRVVGKLCCTLATVIIFVGLFFGALVMHEIGWIFREGKPMTLFSFIALLTIGYVMHQVWVENSSTRPISLEQQTIVWWFLSWGFYIAAWDELLRGHETLDRVLHRIAGVTPTPMTDHLDDVFIILYGVIGVIILWRYQTEILRYRSAWPYFVGAVVCGVISVLLDFVSADKPLIRHYCTTEAQLQQMIQLLDVIEESAKAYAEIFFIGVAVAIYEQSRSVRKIESAIIAA